MKTKLIIAILASIILLTSMVSALTIDSVDTNPTEIKPGERVIVTLIIENNLDVDTKNVAVSLDLDNVPFAPFQSSNEVTYEDIKKDRDKEARYELIAFSEAESGTYKIPVKITYTVDDEDKKGSGLISLIINAKPIIKVSVEDGIFIKGENKELSLRIVNLGLGEARLLSLNLKPGLGIKIINNDNVYVGDIESDDFDTVDFQIAISENAGSLVTLPVKISYRDSRNNEITENAEVKIRTYTEKQAINSGLIKKSNTTSIIISVVVIIFLYIIYRKIRKARRKKKANQEAGR